MEPSKGNSSPKRNIRVKKKKKKKEEWRKSWNLYAIFLLVCRGEKKSVNRCDSLFYETAICLDYVPGRGREGEKGRRQKQV